MQQQTDNSHKSFDHNFNLHPKDALAFSQSIYQHLDQFTEGFKERIQIEIEYSNSLLKVSKKLSKHIRPDKPSPMSYLSSAFAVEHEQRARHALQLAQYLHTEIEVPCQNLLKDTGQVLKNLDKQLRKMYKQGENVEQGYQKNLKKYFRAKQQWEEKLMDSLILSFVPGVSSYQIEKSRNKSNEQKYEIKTLETKYLASLEVFNNFASKYNDFISEPLNKIQKQCIQQLAMQADSMRKLIVSEVNMFKNIQYDLLNISRQMESVQPPDEIDIFIKQAANQYTSPIVKFYSDGPINEKSCQIDLKNPISQTFFYQALLKIEHGHLGWMLDNKHNSTLRYCLKQAWKKFEGLEAQQFMSDLEECVLNNKVVEQIPINGKDEKLSSDEVFQQAFSIICTLGSFIRDHPLSEDKQVQTVKILQKQISTHHYFRFIAAVAIEQFHNLREGKLISQVEAHHMILILRLLIDECFKTRDTFVLRLILTIMFQSQVQPPLYLHKYLCQFDDWNSNDVWESILFEGTYEEISLLPNMVKSQLREIYLMRQKNIMFSAMTTYCHYMSMMGCQHIQVQKLAVRFSHAYGVYQQHQKDLLKMIFSSSNSYKKLLAERESLKSQQDRQVVKQGSSIEQQEEASTHYDSFVQPEAK